MKKKISVFTGTRAEYYILKNFISLLKIKKFKVDLLITGSHLSQKYGHTINDIDKKNLNRIFEIKILKKTSEKGLLESSSTLIKKLSNIFSKTSPELFICLGDRYETFIACYVATIFKVPIIHFHGGELTQNIYDDCLRHSITKMSNLHFVSHNTYRKRVIQLGENPKTVFNIGSMSVENINKIKFLNKKQIERKFDLKFNKNNFLITFHPVTLEKNSYKIIENILKTCLKFKNTSIIVNAPNADTESHKIISKIKEYSKSYRNIYYRESLGQKGYLSIVKNCNLVIGNSSSAIIEVPAIGITSINIGERQAGRIFPQTVKKSNGGISNLYFLIKNFLNKKNKVDKTFYKKNSASTALKILQKYNFKNIKKKKFFDL